jgi:hypothetical protein
MGKKKKEENEKRLEDIIPKETLDWILETYHKIKHIEDTYLREYKWLLHELNKIECSLQEITDKGWLPESFTWGVYQYIEYEALHRNKKGLDIDRYFYLKSELETTIRRFNLKTSMKEVSNKTKGQPKQYAKAFLIASLAAEVRSITGKANYKLLTAYLRQYYDIDEKRLAIEIKRTKESQDLLHLMDILSEYKILQ